MKLSNLTASIVTATATAAYAQSINIHFQKNGQTIHACMGVESGKCCSYDGSLGESDAVRWFDTPIQPGYLTHIVAWPLGDFDCNNQETGIIIKPTKKDTTVKKKFSSATWSYVQIPQLINDESGSQVVFGGNNLEMEL
ncbi:hypothetical protein GGI35DRAFT_45591 [Trichoderma velutinum]